MKALREHFGKKLKAAIQAAGSTQAKFAEDLDVATSTVSQWVRGVCFPEDSREDQIYRVLNINEAYFTDSVSTPPITSAQVAEIQKALTKSAVDEISSRVAALELELRRKDEEIRKLKDKIKRMGDDYIDVGADDPEFKKISDSIQAELKKPGFGDATDFVEGLFPADHTKSKKGAG